MGKYSHFDCPACFGQQHSAHVDGNKKLYRYSKISRYLPTQFMCIVIDSCIHNIFRGVRDSYYNECLRWIVPNDDVDKHLEELGYEDDIDQVLMAVYTLNAIYINISRECAEQADGRLLSQLLKE